MFKDKFEIIDKFLTASDNITIDSLKSDVREILKNSSRDNTIWSVISMEEMAECQQAISKYIRCNGDKLNLTEEIADVILSIAIISEIYDIDYSDLVKVLNIKIERLKG